MRLLRRQAFASLFWTQFLSAFGDNVLKNALVFVILHTLVGSGGEALVTLAGGVFIAPFFFMSGLGGQLADRSDKALMTRQLKLLEGVVSLVAALGFVLSSIPILFVALFLYGVIAALFGPVKYGILPDILATDELGAGNALIEGATFLAILFGTIAGGLLAGDDATGWPAALAVVGLAALCWLTSLFMPRQRPAAPAIRVDANIARSTGRLVRALHADAALWKAGILVSIFWLVGAVVLSLLPPLVRTHLGGKDTIVTAFLAIFAVAIALGSAGGARLMAGRIDLRAVPYAALAMALFAGDAALSLPSVASHGALLDLSALTGTTAFWRTALDLAGLAVAGGVFVVPTFAAVQAWSPPANRARMVAAVNIVTAGFMVGGAVVVGALQAAGVSLNALFALVGVVCALCAAWSFRIRSVWADRPALPSTPHPTRP